MSDIYITKFLLYFEDKNIIPDGNPCTYLVSLSNGVTVKLLRLKTTTQFVVCPECGQIVTKLYEYSKVNIKHYNCGKQPIVSSLKSIASSYNVSHTTVYLFF